MSEVRTYRIGEKTFEQRELVLGQWRQLKGLFEGLEIKGDGNRMRQMVDALEHAGRLDHALAVLLTEQGKSPREKDLDALAAELGFAITPQQIAEVLNDFFTCNPVSSILNQLAGVLAKLVAMLAAGLKEMEMESRRLASCSAEGTGAGETPSCGDAPPGELSPGCGTASGS